MALASLAAIPAMVAADGRVAWGAIVVGQAVGGVAAVVVGYGWGVFGPARIANQSATVRRVEYIEAIRAELALLIPISAIAAGIACVLAPDAKELAAFGAIAITSVGLTPQWYYVGVGKPYTMLVLDTFPRAGGTTVGIVLMHAGHSALTGLIGMLSGVLAGFVISTVWVLRSTVREGAELRRPRTLRTVLSAHRHGIASSLCAAVYYSAPLMIVSVIAPGIQPSFALADKIQTQAASALSPASTVLQGWVPRATGAALVGRIKAALVAGSAFAVVIGICAAVLIPPLANWLGNGQISLSIATVGLMSACIAVAFIERVVEVAALAPVHRLDAITRAIVISGLIGAPMVALGAMYAGTTGALVGVLSSLVLCVGIECLECARTTRELGNTTRVRVDPVWTTLPTLPILIPARNGDAPQPAHSDPEWNMFPTLPIRIPGHNSGTPRPRTRPTPLRKSVRGVGSASATLSRGDAGWSARSTSPHPRARNGVSPSRLSHSALR
ncbi:hypothetical protein ACIA48_21000 [Mycobacterium sp. NPDC051804]|uniref:hypothetical protein n=1 Tax=Mycobacterium sp. NPDC051804 TaxID=3364295 RepID=UPI0037B53AB0